MIECSTFRLRAWQSTDKASLVRNANNRAISRNLWDVFPHPYSDTDADSWLARAATNPPPSGIYAIEVDSEAVGGLALERGSDIARLSAEIGYWLGEAYWGRGIASEVVGRVTELAFANSDIVRIFAPVFAWNARSMRVLERNGFTRECILRRAGFKDGVVFDRVIYAKTRESVHPYVSAD